MELNTQGDCLVPDSISRIQKAFDHGYNHLVTYINVPNWQKLEILFPSNLKGNQSGLSKELALSKEALYTV